MNNAERNHQWIVKLSRAGNHGKSVPEKGTLEEPGESSCRCNRAAAFWDVCIQHRRPWGISPPLTLSSDTDTI